MLKLTSLVCRASQNLEPQRELPARVSNAPFGGAVLQLGRYVAPPYLCRLVLFRALTGRGGATTTSTYL